MDNLKLLNDNKHELIFCVKYNKPIFTEDENMKLYLLNTLKEIENEFGKEVDKDGNISYKFVLDSINIGDCYVHLTLKCDPKVGISVVAGRIKRQSASRMRKAFPSLVTRLPSLWTNNTSFKTIGKESTDEMIAKYVESQKEGLK